LRREASLNVHYPAVDKGNSMAFCLKLSPLALALAATASFSTFAQTAPQSLQAITVTGKTAPQLDVESADVSGFGVPLAKSPQSVTVLGADLLSASAAQSLSQVIKLDASLADKPGVIIVREAMIASDNLVWPADITAGEKTAAIAELEALGIVDVETA